MGVSVVAGRGESQPRSGDGQVVWPSSPLPGEPGSGTVVVVLGVGAGEGTDPGAEVEGAVVDGVVADDVLGAPDVGTDELLAPDEVGVPTEEVGVDDEVPALELPPFTPWTSAPTPVPSTARMTTATAAEVRRARARRSCDDEGMPTMLGDGRPRPGHPMTTVTPFAGSDAYGRPL
jgi:hypothetical protein